jgi:hypothetical protein
LPGMRVQLPGMRVGLPGMRMPQLWLQLRRLFVLVFVLVFVLLFVLLFVLVFVLVLVLLLVLLLVLVRLLRVLDRKHHPMTTQTPAICGGATGSIQSVTSCCSFTDSLVSTVNFRRGANLIEKVAWRDTGTLAAPALCTGGPDSRRN